MICLKDVERIYTTQHHIIHALKGVSLDIGEGEIFGIMGRSHAGKSTLMRCINVLDRPTRGSVYIDKYPLLQMCPTELRMARRNIGMISQHTHLLSSRTVYDNVALPLEIIGASPAEIAQRVPILLETVGLIDKAEVYPTQLNGVQKQRAAIARALVNQPKVLLCDEPTASLDPKSAYAILQLLKELNETLGITLLLTTHEIDIIKFLCHRVAILHHGELIEQNSVMELFLNPQSEHAKEFIKANTRLEMPSALRRRLRTTFTEDSYPVLRISFAGNTAQDHIMTQVIQQFGMNIHIIQAHVEKIRDDTMGIMIIEMIGSRLNTEPAIQFLQQQKLYVEVLGYAARIA
jgi:D-methionine transport system ATP-binding protein